MGFPNAYYIPRSEIKTYADGRKVIKMPDAFKKYQLLRIGALFGMHISADKNKIMMSNGNKAIILDGRPMTDYEYFADMVILRQQYNNLHRYATAGLDQKRLHSQKYDIVLPSPDATAEDAYTESYDPVFYIDNLLTDLSNNGRGDKHRKLSSIIKAQTASVEHLVRTTSWGSKALAEGRPECLADSLKKFFEAHQYIYNRQAAPSERE